MQRKIMAILFSDIAGYSRLTEAQLRVFVQKPLADLAGLIDGVRDQLIELNTWGDAIVAVSPDPYVLSHLALDLRDFFRNRNWVDDNLPESLSCRIALHAGAVYTGSDPIRKKEGLVGTQVNLAARIEPVTAPGEVWVTEQFVKLIDPEGDPTLQFDDLGERPLAKKFGSARLYRLRRAQEPREAPPDIIVEPIAEAPRSRELEIAIHMAKHGAEQQRRVGLDLLDRFNESEAISTLLEVARDKSEPHELRRMALGSLAVLRSRAAVLDVMAIVEDPDELPDLVGYAIQVLGTIRDFRAIESIQKALFGPTQLELDAVKAALVALAKIGDPAVAPMLRQAFDQEDRFRPVIRELISASAVIKDPSFVEPLQAVARDSGVHSPDARGMAVHALMFVSPTASEELFIELAQDEAESEDVRNAAVLGLAAVPGARSKGVLEELAADLSSSIAPRALRALIKGSSLIEELEKGIGKAARGEK